MFLYSSATSHDRLKIDWGSCESFVEIRSVVSENRYIWVPKSVGQSVDGIWIYRFIVRLH